jgi:flagellar biosynthesis activator protein FlaF
MEPFADAVRAYQGATAQRSLREQEADVFRRANGALRSAQDSGPVALVRALVDNRRLWSTVLDLVRDPDNRLPAPLRAAIVSVGMTVQREMDQAQPDVDFLIEINNQVAVGLSGAFAAAARPPNDPV